MKCYLTRLPRCALALDPLDHLVYASGFEYMMMFFANTHHLIWWEEGRIISFF
jgi:hypothetical protein